MARTRRADEAVVSAQEARKDQEVPQDVQGQETPPDAAQEGREEQIPEAGAIGPEDEAELAECVLTQYAVAGTALLNLRSGPSLDARIIAALPQGAGVFEDGEPSPEGWLHVCTGRLEGWMMSRYLEALPLPELTAYGAD